ncbi:putative v-SNARE, coiled-coil domain-containing protein [Helianthus annuus]|nr:putative v-SNARE, coiled-coil domain-containing protein [Helianthus annuus]
MMENIEKVLDRGEKIEILVDKTENLRSQAEQGALFEHRRVH